MIRALQNNFDAIMQPAKKEFDEARKKLLHEKFREYWDYGVLALRLEQMANMFERTNVNQHLELIAEFHNCAGRISYIDDRDFGALVLESAADNIAKHELRLWLYVHAKFRATWCAQAGTSGGESMSRFRRVQRLEEKLSSNS